MIGIARRPRRAGLAAVAVTVLILTSIASSVAETSGLRYSVLLWLARQQQQDGAWGFPGSPPAERVRLTGMVLLNYLGAGYTHVSPEQYEGIRYGKTVRNALNHLVDRQGPDGRLVPSADDLEAHLWGTLALSEAYGLTDSATLRMPATKATTWVEKMQRPDGGWGNGADADPLLTALAAAVLRLAASGQIPVTESVSAKARRALDAWRAKELTPATSAAVLAVTLMTGGDKTHPALLDRARRIALDLRIPENATPSTRYWGLLSLFLADGPYGPSYASCDKRMKSALLDSMAKSDNRGDSAGFWDPPEMAELPAAAPPTSVPPEIRRRAEELIAQLADEEWDVRDRATAGLLQLGPEVIPLVLEATTRSDPEVVHRAGHVARTLSRPCEDNRRIETTCLNGLTLMVCFRHRYVFGMPTP